MTLKTKITMVLLVCSVMFSFGQIQNYSYKQDLQNPSEIWHSISLPNTIFSKVKSNLSDIRLYGITAENDTIEAPYILKLNSERVVKNPIPFKVINESKTGEGFYYTFQTEGDVSLNEIKLKFGIKNFDWKVKLEGSQNQNEWFTILDDYRILSIKTANTNYSYTTLAFKTAKYRYFRLFVKSAKNPKFVRASISNRTITKGEYEKYNIENASTSQDKKAKKTVVNLDLNGKLPISKVSVNIANDFDYYRAFKLDYASDSIKTEKGLKYSYTTLVRGTLNSIEENRFNFKTVLAKKLRLIIYDADNQPLNVKSVSVEGYKHQLIARFTEAAKYSLVYGNSASKLPNYDIKTFEKNIPADLKNLTLGEIQTIQKTDSENASPLFESKYWLWGIMLIIILLLGGFTLKMISKK